MIVVTGDRGHQLVRARISGFLTPEDVRKFEADKISAAAAMGLGSGAFNLLVETTDGVIHSAHVVAEFTRVVLKSAFKSKRMAVVRPTNLTRMQSRRILNVRDNAATFETVEEAERWLFSPAPETV